MSKTTITTFKTNRINKYTGGKIANYENKEMCFENEDINDPKNYTLYNSFMVPDGTYLGDYSVGWWYFKNNLLVSTKHPHGVAIVLKDSASKLKDLNINNPNPNYIKGYLGYSHRASVLFTIGVKLFDESYEPQLGDHPIHLMIRWEADRLLALTKAAHFGWYKTPEEAEKNMPLSEFVPYTHRGSKTIETLQEAEQAAINIMKYLS